MNDNTKYDEWFRGKVEEAMKSDDKGSISHEEFMKTIRSRLDNK